jgi:DnaA family protein
LRQSADRRGIFLGDEVMDFLLTRFPRDLASLSELLDRIDRYSMAQKRQVTLPLVRRMLVEPPEALP